MTDLALKPFQERFVRDIFNCTTREAEIVGLGKTFLLKPTLYFIRELERSDLNKREKEKDLNSPLQEE